MGARLSDRRAIVTGGASGIGLATAAAFQREGAQVPVESMHLLGIGTPDNIAPAAVFLASDQSRYATGAALPIDGGSTAV